MAVAEISVEAVYGDIYRKVIMGKYSIFAAARSQTKQTTPLHLPELSEI